MYKIFDFILLLELKCNAKVIVGILAQKKVHSYLDGFIVLSVYPFSIALVAVLEAIGWS